MIPDEQAEGGKKNKSGAGDRSRTYTGVSPEDFESSASAIPPLRHVSILGQDSLVGNRCPGTACFHKLDTRTA